MGRRGWVGGWGGTEVAMLGFLHWKHCLNSRPPLTRPRHSAWLLLPARLQTLPHVFVLLGCLRRGEGGAGWGCEVVTTVQFGLGVRDSCAAAGLRHAICSLIRFNYIAYTSSGSPPAFSTCLLPPTGRLWDILIRGIPQANFCYDTVVFNTINICQMGMGVWVGAEQSGRRG